MKQFDDQLAALRQRIVLPPSRPRETLGTRSDETVVGTSTGVDIAPKVRSMLYDGVFGVSTVLRVPLSSSNVPVDDKTASTMETLRYLKRATRDRVEEFEEMSERFTYNEEEEAAAFTRKQFGDAKQCPVLSYHDPVNDPFVFEDVAEQDAQRFEADQANSRHRSSPSSSTIAVSAPRSATPRRSFESAYDVTSALVAPSKPRTPIVARPSPSGAVGSSVTPSQSVSLSLFSSQMPSIKKAPATTTTTLLGPGGTAVASSSVSVAEHIRQGAARMIVKEHTDVHQSHLSSRRQRHYRPSCTVEVVESVGIRFCSECGHCNTAPLHREDEGGAPRCAQCGTVVSVAGVVSSDKQSSRNPKDEEALRQIQEMEAREALAFQAAVTEWRCGGHQPSLIHEPSTLISEHVPDAVGTHLVATSTLPTLSLPAGATYFSHLWEQMEISLRT
jgi:hypothetical protein